MTSIDDRAWKCSVCDEHSAALARVRELADEWATAGGAYRRHADLIRDAIDGEGA